MKKKLLILATSAICVFANIGTSVAQFGSGAVTLPEESQKAMVEQTIGLTDIEIVYHRPAVKNRTIWGDLVPYNNGKPIPWRGGANENTTISLSTDVTIEGKALPAGIYGLHFIPAADVWTVIFSKNHTSWGSFTYDEKEDALRITVKPVQGSFKEYLTYQFDEVKPSEVTAKLCWDKIEVPFHIAVDLEKTVIPHITQELRNTEGFTWRGYESAAKFCLDNNMNLDQGLEWVNESISDEARFDNLETKSQILRKQGNAASADSVFKIAMTKASALDLHSYGRRLLRDKKNSEAMDIFRFNVKNHPDDWFVYAGMARGYEANGDLDKAIEQMKIALAKAPDAMRPSAQTAISGWEEKLKKQ
ncbi:MAG TPA: DUF2911 domain-containing protein [Candidatus Kapabacteria bacterium]|nr:DUF2911 domain-containing protein [Candidatus Kapabacteria bacterium]